MVKNMLDICSRYLYTCKLDHFVIIPPRTLYCQSSVQLNMHLLYTLFEDI